jgi:hypothetical protein
MCYEQTYQKFAIFPEDNELLLQLKGKGLSWDETSDRFLERSKGTLQVHYITTTKRESVIIELESEVQPEYI